MHPGKEISARGCRGLHERNDKPLVFLPVTTAMWSNSTLTEIRQERHIWCLVAYLLAISETDACCPLRPHDVMSSRVVYKNMYTKLRKIKIFDSSARARQ
jgi:hypothetical protein